jgi:adenylate cyclase
VAETEIKQRLAAILAADAVGFSRLMGTDEQATLRELDANRALFRVHTEQHGGRIVDMAGDSVLAVFASAAGAVRAAVAAQAAVTERCATVPEDRRMRYRIGVNLGDIIEKPDGSIYGDGVNIAARLQSLAEPGGILLSGKVHDEVQGRVNVGLAAAGEHKVKNIARPLRTYRVVAAGEAKPLRQEAEGPPPLPDKPSIAVLPFDNMSGDAEQEYFADGITEDIITDISKVSGLFVIARNSSFAYKDKAVNVREVGRELGVKTVLEGSVRKAGNRVRITAQLIDAASGGHLWAERYDRDLDDIFAVQDEVTRAIVDALKVRLTPDESARVGRRGTADVDAYDLYVRGRQQLQRYTAESVAEARQLFEQAIALDPNFGAAYAGVAITFKNDLLNQRSPDRAAAQKLFEDYAAKAVALDPDEPTIHWARAADYISRRQSAEAVREVRAWLRVEPSSDLAHGMLAQSLLYDEAPAEAVSEIEYAMRLNPSFPDLYLHVLGHALLLTRDYDAAEDALRRRIRRNPATDASRMLLASLLGHRGRADEARAEWAELLRHHPGFVLAERRKGWFYSNPADEEFVIEGLRRAGLGE